MAESGGSLMASFVQPLVAGSAGGCGAVLAGHPFETIKARIAPTAGHLRWWRGDYSVSPSGTCIFALVILHTNQTASRSEHNFSRRDPGARPGCRRG